jgi:predicted Fe-S protein YdhL (DUF1289 family)
MLDQPVKTPCIGVCSTGIGDAVCRGCKRFAHEVIDWNSYSTQQKRLIDRRLDEFLSRCVGNRLRVIDAGLLRRQLELQQVRFNPEHSEYSWAYFLLKAGAGQIEDCLAFGLELLPAVADRPLAELVQEIDLEFYTLSAAHHERYFAAPARRTARA